MAGASAANANILTPITASNTRFPPAAEDKLNALGGDRGDRLRDRDPVGGEQGFRRLGGKEFLARGRHGNQSAAVAGTRDQPQRDGPRRLMKLFQVACIAVEVCGGAGGLFRRLASGRLGRAHGGAAALAGVFGGPTTRRSRTTRGSRDRLDTGTLEGGCADGVSTARLASEDGLIAGEAAGGRQEFPRPADGLGGQDDGAGLGGGAEIVDEVCDADVEHVAGGDEGGKANAALNGPIQDGSLHRGGLRNEAHVPGRRHGRGKADVECPGRDDHAQRVGAEDSQAVEAALLFADPLFECSPPGTAFR